jgi:hypothetical protein
MKIKFQISETSQLEPQAVIDKILLLLKKQNYIIEDRTNSVISFKDDNWEMRSKNTGFRKVDKGSFEVTLANEGTLIRYIYYISFLPEIIITAIVLFGTFALSHLVLLIALPLWIQLGVRIYTLKDVSTEMIKRLAS